MKIKITPIALLFTALTLTTCNAPLSSSNPSNKVTSEVKQVTVQSTPEQDNSMQSILDDSAQLEKVAGDFQFIEGPAWHPDGFLLFSDIPANTIYKLAANGKAEIFRRPSGNANGNTFDKEGRLITAEHSTHRLSRTEKDGKVVTLVDKYDGKRFNSPNDLAVKSDGSIYFTDPGYGVSKEQKQLDFYGVYRLAPDGKLTLLIKDMVQPNGIALSPDEKKLYVNNSEAGYIGVSILIQMEQLVKERVFAELKDAGKIGVPDGLKVDVQGNVYSTGAGGIWILSPAGKLLGRISIPEMATNVAWGDKDYKTLYITASKSLYRIRLKIAGAR
ncbi:MAG: SMP-30/gluconolactonase/LRE family protein [Microcoleus sp. SU_5_6]|nr:SMP-30/gluconolactonase/LRE family protein [Microcoleus sp. SU_5_6]